MIAYFCTNDILYIEKKISQLHICLHITAKCLASCKRFNVLTVMDFEP